MNHRQDLLEALLHLRATEPKPKGGICTCIPERLSHRFTDLAKGWEKFSGDSYYPVPSPVRPGPENAESYYWHTNPDMFWQGPYGELRRELLDYAIKTLEDSQ